MRLEPVDTADARAVLRALRGAVLGAGPAVALGATAPRDVPAGTAVVVTTSGSTGYPKSVVLSRAALTSGALATADRLGSGSWLLALPPTYIAGVQVLVRALVADREPAILSRSVSSGGLRRRGRRHGLQRGWPARAHVHVARPGPAPDAAGRR